MEKIKEMSSEDYSKMYDLASYAFNFGEKSDAEVAKFNEIATGSWNYGFFKDEKLLSQVMATPFDVDLHGGRYKMLGIGYVSTYPEARGQGAINALMHQILQDANERGVDLSYLAPFSYDFYEKYGYRLVFHRVHYKVRNEKFRIFESFPGTVQRQEYAKIKSVIQSIFNQMPRNKKGGVVREPWWLDYKFGNKEVQFAIYTGVTNEIEGYVVYQFDDDTFVIKDFGYLSYPAYSSLLRFCQSHAGTFRDFVFNVGYHDPFFDEFSNDIFSTQMTISPDMMARIVNIGRFIEAYPFKKDLSFSLQVVDDKFAPWNNGGYEICVENGKAKVSATEAASYDLSGNIQSLTELFMGSKSPSELAFKKSLAGNDAIIKQLDEAIYTEAPILEEYF